jgi:hypothetical protein
VFQPSFLRSRGRSSVLAGGGAPWSAGEFDYSRALGGSRVESGRRLTAINIIVALPSWPNPGFVRPRPFGNGLRKARSQESLVELLVGDGFPGAESAASRVSERGKRMRGPSIGSIDTLTLDEALSYMDLAEGDELVAAFELAHDRNVLDGGTAEPDDTEVHHALFMLRRARGLAAPSFDSMRIQLRRLSPAA